MKDATIPSREDLSILSDGLFRIGQIESPNETRLEDGESARLKKAVESFYSFCTSIANSSNFWNFGLKDKTTDFGIRERLKPDSFAMRHFRKEIGTNVAKKIILRQFYEVALGSEFLGHSTAPVYRAANSMFLPASKRFTGDRYVLHSVSRH